MIRPHQHFHPTSLDELIDLLTRFPNALIRAGGSDVGPDLVMELVTPEVILSIGRVPELNGIRPQDDDSLRIGATTTLTDIVRSGAIARTHPLLVDACGMIADHGIRNSGTLVGNIALTNRCRWDKRSYNWRLALATEKYPDGGCLKNIGKVCHVTGSERLCVAARSGDSVPALIAMDASVSILLDGETHVVKVKDLMGTDGRNDRHLMFKSKTPLPGRALITEVLIPAQPAGARCIFVKAGQTHRTEIDFAQVNMAIVAVFNGNECIAITGILSAILPKPRELKLNRLLTKGRWTDALIEEVAREATARIKALPNILTDRYWREEVGPMILLKRALTQLRDSA